MTARILATARIFPETRTILERAGSVLHPAGEDPWDAASLRAALAGAEAMTAFMDRSRGRCPVGGVAAA